MADTTVKYFDSTMTSAPGDITTSVGTILAVLDACLVDGFGEVTLDSLSVSSNVATATIATGHNFAMIGEAGPVILIAGATPSGLNGEWRVTVTSSTQFTFATSGISDGAATGTLTAKRAPAGWEKLSVGTNENHYRSLDVNTLGPFLRFWDDDAASVYVGNAYIMEGTFGGAASILTASHYLSKSASYAKWEVVSDTRAFYLITHDGSGSGYSAFFFGDLSYPYDVLDSYAVGIAGNTSASSTPLVSTVYGLIYSGGSTNNYGAQLAKDKGGTGAVYLYRIAHPASIANNAIGGGGISIVGGSEIIYPVEAWEDGGGVYRGKMPGWYASLHGSVGITNPLEHGGIGKTLKPIPLRYYNTVAWQLFDITGPWR